MNVDRQNVAMTEVVYVKLLASLRVWVSTACWEIKFHAVTDVVVVDKGDDTIYSIPLPLTRAKHLPIVVR